MELLYVLLSELLTSTSYFSLGTWSKYWRSWFKRTSKLHSVDDFISFDTLNNSCLVNKISVNSKRIPLEFIWTKDDIQFKTSYISYQISTLPTFVTVTSFFFCAVLLFYTPDRNQQHSKYLHIGKKEKQTLTNFTETLGMIHCKALLTQCAKMADKE